MGGEVEGVLLRVSRGVDSGEGHAAIDDFQIGLVFHIEAAESAAWYCLGEPDELVGADDCAGLEGGRVRRKSEEGEREEELGNG